MMARPKKPFPDEKDQRVWEVIVRYYRRHGMAPTVREIQRRAKLSSTSVVKAHLDRLAEHGCLTFVTAAEEGEPVRKARNLRPLPTCPLQPPLEETRLPQGVLPVPLYGLIAAGEPMPRPDASEPLGEVPIPVDFLPRRYDDLFALEVRGNSMIDAMVNDGDIVVLRPTSEAHKNEMVAVWLRDREETTLKYYIPEYDPQGRLKAIRLRPANPTMEDIVIDDPSQVEIKGKVVMVIRRLDRRPVRPPSGKGNVSSMAA